MRRFTWLSLAGLLFAAASTRGDLVQIDVTGNVAFNVIQGNMVGVQLGDPVMMSFRVDSNVFVNSTRFPTRGYNMILNSFSMTVGGRPVPIVNPQPSGQTAYFVLRNNDPVVDGFLLTTNVDAQLPVSVNIIGLTPIHDLTYVTTYNGDFLSSLNILDAIGTYGHTGLNTDEWDIGRFGNPGAIYSFQSMRISLVPEPPSLGLLMAGCLGLGLLTRARRPWVKPNKGT
jgi:hypothetical protein